jgi:hypothetical protein
VRLSERHSQNNQAYAFVDRTVAESISVEYAQQLHRLTVDRRRIMVGERRISEAFAALVDEATIRIKLGAGAVDYVEEAIPPDSQDAAVAGAFILGALFGNADARYAGRTMSYVGSTYLALVLGQDPGEAMRRWPHVKNRLLADHVSAMRGKVRLHKADIAAPDADGSTREDGDGAIEVSDVPIERRFREETTVRSERQVREVERRENELVEEYASHLAAKRLRVRRKKIRVRGESAYLFNDIFVARRNQMIEAKGAGTREDIRMAIGQIADYGRFVNPPPATAVLLRERPHTDLEALLDSQGIAAIWRGRDGTSRTTAPASSSDAG